MPHEQISGDPDVTPSTATPPDWHSTNEKRPVALSGLWAGHPAVTGNGVQHVQAVSSRAIPSHRRAAPGSCRAAWFTTVPGMQKVLGYEHYDARLPRPGRSR